MARLPIRPQQVMPPEGIAPVTQDVDTTGQDALSPTTQVLNYLKARGYTPSTENVRRALEANARDPGVISGLRSDTAATDAEDRAAMAARGGGGGGSVAKQVEGGSNPPMVDLGKGPTNEADWQPQNTSAPPAGGGTGAGGWLTALLGSGGALASAILNRISNPNLSLSLNPGGGTPQPGVPVPGAALPGQPNAALPAPPGALPPPAGGPPPAGSPALPPPGTPPAAPGTGPTDMETAMQRATAPASGPIALPDSSGVAAPGMANVDVPFRSPSPRVPPAQPLSLRPGGGGVNFIPKPKVRVPAPVARFP
jgi:hypothetical protein